MYLIRDFYIMWRPAQSDPEFFTFKMRILKSFVVETGIVSWVWDRLRMQVLDFNSLSITDVIVIHFVDPNSCKENSLIEPKIILIAWLPKEHSKSGNRFWLKHLIEKYLFFFCPLFKLVVLKLKALSHRKLSTPSRNDSYSNKKISSDLSLLALTNYSRNDGFWIQVLNEIQFWNILCGCAPLQSFK